MSKGIFQNMLRETLEEGTRLKVPTVKELLEEVTKVNQKEKMTSKEVLEAFGTWVQDNFSQNVKEGSKNTLPRGIMRRDFTNDHVEMEEIAGEFLKRFVHKI